MKAPAGIITFEQVVTQEHMLKSYKHVRKGKKFRTKTILYHMNHLKNLSDLAESLDNGSYEFGELNRFRVYEPKEREVVADGFEDKIVQDLISRYVLKPLLGPKMIYDNYASQPKKGTHVALKRLEKHTAAFAKSTDWTGEGWVLVCDLSKFFYNIDHEVCWSLVNNLPVDEKLSNLLHMMIDACTAEINPYVEVDGKGLCIGFQTSQWLAVYYLNKLDHLIKEKLHIKYYGRYMDDFYLVHESKEYLEYCLKVIEKFVESVLKMKLNPKTHIHPFTQGICFLGYHVTYNTTTHQVETSIRTKSIHKMKKRTRRQLGLISQGKLTVDKAKDSLGSWHAYAMYGETNRSINAYDQALAQINKQVSIVEQYQKLCDDWTNVDTEGFFRLKVKKGAVPKDSDGFMVLMKRKKSKREAWEDDVRERVKSDPVKYANLNLKAMLSINDLIEKTPHRISKRTKAKRKLRTAQASLIDPSTTKL